MGHLCISSNERNSENTPACDATVENSLTTCRITARAFHLQKKLKVGDTRFLPDTNNIPSYRSNDRAQCELLFILPLPLTPEPLLFILAPSLSLSVCFFFSALVGFPLSSCACGTAELLSALGWF